MKKLIALLMAALMMLSVFTACGTKEETPEKPDAAPEVQPEEKPEETPEEQPEETPEETPAETPDTSAIELSTLLADIYAIKQPEFMTAEIPCDLSDPDAVFYNTGLEDASLISEVVVSESAMGSQAYSLVLVRVADPAKTAEVAEAMKTGINPRKWICVEADDLRVVAAGDIVMLIMVESAFAPTITADGMVDAFKQASGLELDIE